MMTREEILNPDTPRERIADEVAMLVGCLSSHADRVERTAKDARFAEKVLYRLLDPRP